MKTATSVLFSECIFDGIHKETFAGGVAINNSKIVAVGNRDEIAKWIGKETEVRDVGDFMISPGFIDPHVHLDATALAESGRQSNALFNAKSAQNCLDLMKQFADQHRSFSRIIGFGWDVDKWDNDSPIMNKKMLDDIIPDRPVYLYDSCYHTVWCNSKGLEESGITRETSVAVGSIGKDEHGEPNGLLYESEAFAASFAHSTIFDTREISTVIYKNLFNHIAELGITSICCMGLTVIPTDENYVSYDIAGDLEAKGELSTRLFLFPSLGWTENIESWKKLKQKYHSALIKMVGLKQFVDGIVHQQTAFFKEPYSGLKTNGSSFVPQKVFNSLVSTANAKGFPVRLHAIGDAAVMTAITAFEYSQRQNGRFPFYNGIEHANCMDLRDIDKLRSLRAVVSTQPQHSLYNLDAYRINIGDKRTAKSYPVASLVNNGILTSIGSDAPCADMNPFLNIHAAATRRTPDGEKVAGAAEHEVISVFESLKCHMNNAAYNANSQNEIGDLTPGKWADIVVIDRNLMEIEVNQIPKAQILLTICNGKTVYSKL